MALKRPESMEECVYYSSRDIGEGEATVWVFKQACPECGKALMGKPRKDDGKVKIRAKEYVCPECNYTVEKKEYEETLTASVAYICPHCKHEAETEIPFKRKTYQGVKAIVFNCESCNEKIPITKKMKEPKKKSQKK